MKKRILLLMGIILVLSTGHFTCDPKRKAGLSIEGSNKTGRSFWMTQIRLHRQNRKVYLGTDRISS